MIRISTWIFLYFQKFQINNCFFFCLLRQPTGFYKNWIGQPTRPHGTLNAYPSRFFYHLIFFFLLLGAPFLLIYSSSSLSFCFSILFLLIARTVFIPFVLLSVLCLVHAHTHTRSPSTSTAYPPFAICHPCLPPVFFSDFPSLAAYPASACSFFSSSVSPSCSPHLRRQLFNLVRILYVHSSHSSNLRHRLGYLSIANAALVVYVTLRLAFCS